MTASYFLWLLLSKRMSSFWDAYLRYSGHQKIKKKHRLVRNKTRLGTKKAIESRLITSHHIDRARIVRCALQCYALQSGLTSQVALSVGNLWLQEYPPLYDSSKPWNSPRSKMQRLSCCGPSESRKKWRPCARVPVDECGPRGQVFFLWID
jgi:hypothetical protein